MTSLLLSHNIKRKSLILYKVFYCVFLSDNVLAIAFCYYVWIGDKAVRVICVQIIYIRFVCRNIPSNYKILFLQGGATAQFSAVPLNLLQRSPQLTCDYIVTGTWSAKAVKEVKLLLKIF